MGVADRLTARDIISIILLIGCLYLKAMGIDTYIDYLLFAVVGYYLGFVKASKPEEVYDVLRSLREVLEEFKKQREKQPTVS